MRVSSIRSIGCACVVCVCVVGRIRGNKRVTETQFAWICKSSLFVCACVTPVDLVTRRVRQQQQLLHLNLHLLANPGDSLLLQHTLDRLLRWLCPSLRIFHVSERASPYRSYTRLSPVAGVWSCMCLYLYMYYVLFFILFLIDALMFFLNACCCYLLLHISPYTGVKYFSGGM